MRCVKDEKNNIGGPWLAACAALAGGEAVGFVGTRFAPLWPFFLFLAVLNLLWGYGVRFRLWWVPFLALVGITLALFAGGERTRVLTEETAGRNPFVRSLRVEGGVETTPARERGFVNVSFPTVSDGIRLRVNCRLRESSPRPRRGEVWRCAGWLDNRLPVLDMRPRSLWVRGRGTFAYLERSAAPSAWETVRDDLSRRLGIGLSHAPEMAELNRAILLGRRSRLPMQVRRVFIEAGTMHIFAISGLHVMVVARVVFIFLTLLMIPLRGASICLIPILWAYVYLIGMGASAVRAAAMASIYLAAPVFWRRPNALIAWSLTFLAVHLVSPLKLLDVGSLLSFVVMLGILLCLWWMKLVRLRRGETLLVTLCAWWVGVPISAVVFGRVTPGGILANLILVPTAAANVMSSAVGILVSFLSPTLAAHVNNAAALFTRAMVGISWMVSRLPGANLEIGEWTVGACVAWYGGLILLAGMIAAYRNRRRML